jgi:molecular chaperone GrpE
MTRKSSTVGALNALDLALESQRLDAEQEEFVEQLLPLLDNVERLCRGLDEATVDAVMERRDALALLADIGDKVAGEIGLERIGTRGELARPESHEVVDTEPRPDQPHGAVLDIVQFGWRFRGRVLRPAKVVAGFNK